MSRRDRAVAPRALASTSLRADLSILRCPASGSQLSLASDGALVSLEGRRYEVLDGVPVLLDFERSLFDADDFTGATEPVGIGQKIRRALNRIVPDPTRSLGARDRFERLGELVKERDVNPRILIIGGGILGEGMEGLAEDEALELVETDVYLGDRTQLVCDAHHLPFADACFDAVVAQAVLEHVMDPRQVADEIHRVLKPAGLVYAETPFMQQVHEGAYDITRFTMVGHRRLFRGFDELEAGVVCGPGTALLWSLRYFVRSFPRRSRLARELLDRAVCFGFFWIKYLDDFLVTSPGAIDAASGVFFMGRRRDSPISDREVVESYRGGFRSAPRR